MWKTIIKKCWKDVFTLAAIMMFLLIGTYSIMPFSNVCEEHQLLFFELLYRSTRCAIVVVAIGSLIENIITEFELFSANKWIRRTIIISIGILLASISMWMVICGSFSAFPSGLLLVSLIFVGVVGAILSVIGYFIEDKRRKKEIADINERLNTLNSK